MKFDFSIVIPVYFNAGSLYFVEKELRSKVLKRSDRLKGELVFVDDGSGDESVSVLQKLKDAHPDDIRIYKLSRNFGQAHAVWCGIEHCENTVIVTSADGQDPVSAINTMIEKHFNEKCEIVIALRESRDESAWRKGSSGLVYWLMRKLVNKDMPAGGFDFYLLGENARIKLVKNWQPNTFMQARILNLGFSRAWIGYNREARKAGTSRWTFSKKLTYMIDGVLGHSYVPIRAISILGLLFSGLSFLLGIYFFISYFFNPTVVRGWTPIILLILFVGGIQMMMIGVLGEYLWRVLAQTRQNPPYIVEKEYT